MGQHNTSDLQNGTAPSHTVVLYLSSLAGASKTLGREASASLWTLGGAKTSAGLSNLGFVPVSPWEIDCVERVARLSSLGNHWTGLT